MSLSSILALTGGAVPTIDNIATQFGVNWWGLIAQIISFSLVCILLNKFAYKPILAVLEERRTKIADGLAAAEAAKVSLASAEAKVKELLDAAHAQSQKLIDDARAAAKQVGERESQRAIIEAEQIIAKAREATKLDHDRMLGELKREVARLVIDTTGKVTGKVLTADDQRRLSEEASRAIAA